MVEWDYVEAGMEDLIGKSLGRYHVLEQLGEGGMATVYKAYDTNLEREVAIKIIRREAFPPEQSDLLLKRFEREAKALAKLVHPNIVAVIDYGSQDNNPYLVMNYLPGGTLKQKLGKPMSWPEAVHLLLPIARALQFAHAQGIIHRDVKPSNILLTESGDPMLTDFGIAKILEAGAETQLTATGVGIGTPDYMAPEQWTGTVDPQTDIYSLGVVLYQMVTGRLPFIADTPAAVLIKHARDPLPRPKSFVPDLPDAVEQVLIKALAKEPENRFQDMGAFANALYLLTKTEPTVLAPVSEQPEHLQPTLLSPPVPDSAGTTPGAVTPSPMTRKRTWLVGLTVGIGVLMLVGAAIVLSGILRHPGIQISKPLPSPLPTTVITAILPLTQSIPTITVQRTPIITASPTYRARISITTTSDWTTLRLIGGAKWSPTVVLASAHTSYAAYDKDGSLRLLMPIGQAGGTQSVNMIVDVGLQDLIVGGKIEFQIERGALGSTQVEVMNYLTESPISIGDFDWSKTNKPPQANTYNFEIPSSSLMELRQVSIKLGAMNVSNGLVQVGNQLGDGRTAPANIGGKEARVTVTNGSPGRFIYFSVDPAFLAARSEHVSITIEYFNKGIGSDFWFNVDYDSPGPGLASEYKSTPMIRFTNNGQWKTATFDLPDAFFGKRENYNADFRISTLDRDLYFSTVTVMKK